MATPEQIAALEHIILSSPYNGFSLTRYFQASALTCTLYDHLLTLNDEIAFLWSGGPLTDVKALYILIRFGIEAGLLYLAFMFSGFRPHLSDEFCKSYAPVVWTCTMVSSICTSLYVVFHHYTVWDRSKTTFYILLGCFVATFIPATYFGVKSVFDYRAAIAYLPMVDSCAPVIQPTSIKGYWACLVAFDVLALVVIIMNSFHRPYTHRQDVVSSLRRDGAVWFVIIVCLSFTNFLVSTVAKPEYIALIVFNIWSLTTNTLCRVILRTEGLKKNKPGSVRLWNTDVGGFELTRFTSAGY